jgi:hypothetical protein
MARVAHATITVDQFVANTMGQQLANAQGTYSGECVSLVSQYLLQVYGVTTGAWGNAIDYQSGGSGGSHLVANGFSWSTDQSFANGDILVWGPNAQAGTSSYGHVGIWYGGRVYDQNDGRHSPARTAGYSTFWTGGYLGHWRKGTVVPPVDVVSPGDARFTKGPAAGWYSVIGGGNCGQAIFTYVNNTGASNWGRWTWDLSQLNGSARYDVQTFIPSRNAGTRNAVYRINTASGWQSHSVNQNASSGWVDLGIYSLAAGSAWVDLNDNTGEAYAVDENHEIAFDSIKIVYVSPSSFAISSSSGGNGSISPSGPSSVPYGGNQTFTITPSPGYQVSGLAVDGQAVPVATSYSFANVVTGHSISVTFAPIVFSTTLSVAGSSSIRLGKAYRLAGSISPAAAGGKVKIVWKRRVSGKYKAVKTQYAALGQGSFSHSYRPRSRGTWQACVSYPGVGVAPRYLASGPVKKGFRVK